MHTYLRGSEVSSHDVFIPPGPGSCEKVKLHVLQFIKETEEIVLASNSSWFPLGESFLAAKGIQLTDEELSLPQPSPSRETFSEKFLSGDDYAIRLAAQSSECHALLASCSSLLGRQGLELAALQSSSRLCGPGFPRPAGPWERKDKVVLCTSQSWHDAHLSGVCPNPPAQPLGGRSPHLVLQMVPTTHHAAKHSC